MKTDEELNALVSQLVVDNTIPLDEWPDVLEYMLKRLDWIAHNSFPLPRLPPPIPPPAPKPPVSISRESTVLLQSQDEDSEPSNSQPGASNENKDSTPKTQDAAGDTPITDAPPAAAEEEPTVDVPATQPSQAAASSAAKEDPPSQSTQSTTVPSTQYPKLNDDDPANDADETATTIDPTSPTPSPPLSPIIHHPLNNSHLGTGPTFLPASLQNSLSQITNTLSAFPSAPPHTIQRFAELIQKPNKHYRSLAKFLRACNRVIHVTSTIDKFPLPTTHVAETSTGTGGTARLTTTVPNAIPIGSGLVNDEEITGATLTPIPWASAREYVANQAGAGAGGDTVGSPLSDDALGELADAGADSTGGISQGELIRKEQEVGAVPVNSAGGALEGSGNSPLDNVGGDGKVGQGDIDVDGPIVTGPPELGAEDVGPQTKEMFEKIGSPPPVAPAAPTSADAVEKKEGEEGAEATTSGGGDKMDVDEAKADSKEADEEESGKKDGKDTDDGAS